MKKIIILIALVLLIVLSGCSNKENDVYTYSSMEYVDLYEYGDFLFREEEVAVTEDDVNAIILNELYSFGYYKEINDRNTIEHNDILTVQIDEIEERYFMDSGYYGEEFNEDLLHMKKGSSKILNINGVYRKVEVKRIFEPIEIKDEDYITKFYSCNDMREVRYFIENRAREEMMFNMIWDEILNNTTVKSIPKEIEKSMERRKKMDIKIIEKENGSLENYLSSMEITKEMFEDSYNNFYIELMIIKAILDKEMITLTKENIDEHINKIAIEYEISDKTIVEMYGYDYFYYDISFEKIKHVLLEKANII